MKLLEMCAYIWRAKTNGYRAAPCKFIMIEDRKQKEAPEVLIGDPAYDGKVILYVIKGKLLLVRIV